MKKVSRAAKRAALIERIEFEIGQCEKYGDQYGHTRLFRECVEQLKQCNKGSKPHGSITQKA